ncbi:MAG: fused MFS/spermidine synthase [Gammaproteobacteria bacterium]|nr:fused MFS/spermidine synthase [Gammaproteobacteria bacterium]
MLVVVFLTGAAVLVVEIVAVRVLSPYFGNTIFTVSSVISVILAALSLGYFYGGRLSDRHPNLGWFFSIILFGGISVLVLQLMNVLILPVLGYALPITTGPLISSVILFFIPALLLGMLSPYAIKLQTQRCPDEGLGRVAGEVFFWSTLGSIVGSLSAGFVLIPMFGIAQILIGVGVFLVCLGLLPILFGVTFDGRVSRHGSIASALLVLFASLLSFNQNFSGVVYSADGVYERLVVYDLDQDNRKVRYFLQDRSQSGAIFLDTGEFAHEYAKHHRLYKLFHDQIETAVVIGGGAYLVPTKLFHENPTVVVDVIEIEPSLYELSKKYFDLPDSSRIQNHVTDGRRFLFETNQKYDLIYADAYRTMFSVPSHLTTKEFFQLASSRLSDDGVFIGNVIGDLSQTGPNFLASTVKTMQSVFGEVQLYAVESGTRNEVQNFAIVALNESVKQMLGSDNRQQKVNKILPGFSDRKIDLALLDLDSALVLTDNYVPVDYLLSRRLDHWLTDEKEAEVSQM